MSRIRSIKPEFWTSEQILECSANARLLFIGLWNFCDDHGRHPYSARQAKAEVFPADNISDASILSMLRELEANKLITRYAHDGKEYFYVTGWKHQRIDKPQPPKYPDPFGEHSKIIPGMIPPDRIGEDTRGRDNTRSVAKATRPNQDSQFEEFWKAYPKRKGGNPKHPAQKVFEAAVKSGADPGVISAGARRYAELEHEKIGTEYIPHAVKWLRDKRWLDYPPIDGPAAKPLIFLHEDTDAFRAWVKHLGREPPRKNFGWYFESEYPPGHERPEAA